MYAVHTCTHIFRHVFMHAIHLFHTCVSLWMWTCKHTRVSMRHTRRTQGLEYLPLLGCLSADELPPMLSLWASRLQASLSAPFLLSPVKTVSRLVPSLSC